MKKIVVSICIYLLVSNGYCQQIPKWKIDDVVNFYSTKNDSTYVVNFWSTWCGPCVEEIPYLQSICTKYADKKVKLLLVSLDNRKIYGSSLQNFIKQKKITAQVVWLNETDADVYCPRIDSAWSGAIPASIIVNNKAGYKKFYETQFTKKQFEAAIKKAL